MKFRLIYLNAQKAAGWLEFLFMAYEFQTKKCWISRKYVEQYAMWTVFTEYYVDFLEI